MVTWEDALASESFDDAVDEVLRKLHRQFVRIHARKVDGDNHIDVAGLGRVAGDNWEGRAGVRAWERTAARVARIVSNIIERNRLSKLAAARLWNFANNRRRNLTRKLPRRIRSLPVSTFASQEHRTRWDLIVVRFWSARFWWKEPINCAGRFLNKIKNAENRHHHLFKATFSQNN